MCIFGIMYGKILKNGVIRAGVKKGPAEKGPIRYSNVNAKPKTKKYGRSFRNFDDNEFLAVLQNIKWQKIFGNITCPDKLMELFLKTLNEVLDLMAPIKPLSKKEANLKIKPWITKGILKSIKVRDRLYKKYLSKKSNIYLQKYKQYRNLIVTLI